MIGDLEIFSDEDAAWDALLSRLQKRLGRKPGLEGVLFLMGIQSTGRGYSPQLEKEEKQELVMEGTFVALRELGYYRKAGDEWVRTDKALPVLEPDAQEKLIRSGILAYFAANHPSF